LTDLRVDGLLSAMRRVPSSPARRLHVCITVLAMLGMLVGNGLHGVLHASGGPQDARPVAPLEVHGAGCEHGGDTEPHDAGHCLLCKAGGPQVALPRVAATTGTPPAAGRLLNGSATACARALSVPGSLGARAPPVTVG
jgi:hypothetical protein